MQLNASWRLHHFFGAGLRGFCISILYLTAWYTPSGNPALVTSSPLLWYGRLAMIFFASASPTVGRVFNSARLALLMSIFFTGLAGAVFLAGVVAPWPAGICPGAVSTVAGDLADGVCAGVVAGFAGAVWGGA